MDLNATLNEILVKLFRNITTIEEQTMKTGIYKDVTMNDMHVIEAIGPIATKNMTTVAKELSVTTGTLTISVNGLVKKGYVERIRSEEDRRVVFISLTEKGQKAYEHHKNFHEAMIAAIVARLNDQEQEVLQKALDDLLTFFYSYQK